MPLIVEDLTDRQMLQYMGRENLEDYNAAFLIQLESWEAAMKSKLVPSRDGKAAQPIEIAKLLGWTRVQEKTGTIILNNTASACHAAFALIEGGHNTRADFDGLTVYEARNIAERAYSRIEQAMGPKPNMFQVVGAGVHTQITLTLEVAVAIALIIFVAGLLLGMLWCHWLMRRRH